MEIKSVNPKGNQPWIFIGRTDAETEILWSPDAKSWLTGKDLDARKNWGQDEKGVIENEWLDGTIDLMDMCLSKLQEIVKGREYWRSLVHGIT